MLEKSMGLQAVQFWRTAVQSFGFIGVTYTVCKCTVELEHFSLSLSLPPSLPPGSLLCPLDSYGRILVILITDIATYRLKPRHPAVPSN